MGLRIDPPMIPELVRVRAFYSIAFADGTKLSPVSTEIGGIVSRIFTK
jgi:hypothetical protein